MSRRHVLPPEAPVHHTWDAAHPPVLEIADGDVVCVRTRDVSDNQIAPDATAADVPRIAPERLYPLAGPVFVAGAQPGDTLSIEVLDLRTQGWGWTALIPGLGLLADDFPDPHLRIFDLTTGDVTHLREDIAIPIEPFLGTMGVCPEAAAARPVLPPSRFGGNLDTRQLTAGTTLHLPVGCPGGLFSCGDAHAAQGDGEVCVNGIETAMEAELRFTLSRGRTIPAPQYEVPGPLLARVDAGGWYATTGVNGDLYRGAQDAVRALIDWLVARTGLAPEDAYILCSLCADLRISEIVDAGEYVVSALFPLAVLR